MKKQSNPGKLCALPRFLRATGVAGLLLARRLKPLLFLIFLLLLTPIDRARAQTFTVLHKFVNNDGAHPVGRLVVSGNTLYGTTDSGGTGTENFGTVFAINTNGTGFALLHTFGDISEDGGEPFAGLILSGNTLFGTTYGGGNGNSAGGTVFKVNTDGSGYGILHNFDPNDDGAFPIAGVILSGNTLYGTTNAGGSSGFDAGVVFKVNTDGTGYTILHNFTGYTGNNGGDDDGALPYAGVILSGNTLYGTTYSGGTYGLGTVFAINTDGTGYTIVHVFIDGTGGNDDGTFEPTSDLVLSGSTLYSTTDSGIELPYGAVFAVNVDGTGFAVLHAFTGSDGYGGDALFLSANTLYGAANGGGSAGDGTVYSLNINGTGFTTLHNFVSNSDGAYPNGGVILSGNTLYGTAAGGGNSDYGTVFSLQLSTSVSSTWKSNPATGDWNRAANWTPRTVPNGSTATATFASSNETGVSISAATEVNSIIFNSGASAFTITAPPMLTLTFSGAGITNNSGVTQNFVTGSDNAGNDGVIQFTNRATAGSLTTFTNNSGTPFSLGTPAAQNSTTRQALAMATLLITGAQSAVRLALAAARPSMTIRRRVMALLRIMAPRSAVSWGVAPIFMATRRPAMAPSPITAGGSAIQLVVAAA